MSTHPVNNDYLVLPHHHDPYWANKKAFDIIETAEGYTLLIKGSDQAHPLDLLVDVSFITYNARYAYVLDSAVFS